MVHYLLRQRNTGKYVRMQDVGKKVVASLDADIRQAIHFIHHETAHLVIQVSNAPWNTNLEVISVKRG